MTTTATTTKPTSRRKFLKAAAATAAIAAIPLPRIGTTYAGGTLTGVMGANEEVPGQDYLLIDLGYSPGGMSHAAALKWAQAHGGDLATRAEGRLLDANRSAGLPERGVFWLKPQYAGDDGSAWYQDFAMATRTTTARTTSCSPALSAE